MKLTALADEFSSFLLTQDHGQPFIFGISGGQGAGKSTLCQALDKKLATQGRTTLTLSLDDFYLSKAARLKLADEVHPLCATRGVPGTHDVARLSDVLSKLDSISAATPLTVPRFSKSQDDRLDDVMVSARPDFVLLEGWCVGGHADCIKAVAQNDWEIEHDADAIWKSWTREAARAYQQIWDKCESMMLLRQEDFEAVIHSRWRQEQSNAAESGVWQFSDRAAVAEFCAHYQSWTLGIWKDLAQRADFVICAKPGYDYHVMRG